MAEHESMEEDNPQATFDHDEEVDHAAHEKLLKSIYALDGKKRFQNEVRGAPAPSGNLDLVVYTKKDKAKINLEDLDAKKRHATFTLDKPMGDLETERAKRLVAQELMEKDVGKWEPVVQEIRAAPQIKYADRPKGLEMYEAMKPKKFAPRTPLEMEIYEALGNSQDIIHPDQEMTEAERNALKAMSIKDAKERRKELMKHQELLFRMEIKAKRQKKIKSKSYRKFQRKDRITEEKRKLEDMQKNDPEAFMEKMQQLETARMEERLTLKHRGGGKFSRTHKAYSKFDTKTREAVQDMLQKSRELTKKRETAESSDEDQDEDILLTSENVAKLKANTDDEEDEESEGNPVKKTDLSSKHLEILKAVNKKAGGWLDGPTAFVYTDSQKGDAGAEDVGVRHEEDMKECHDSDNVSKSISVGNVLDIDDEENERQAPKKKKLQTKEKTDMIDSISPSPKKSRKRKNEESEYDGEDLQQPDVEADKEMTHSSESVTKQKRKKKKKKKNQQSVEASDAANSSEVKIKPVKEVTLKPSAQEAKDKMEDGEEEEAEEDGMRVTMEELFQDEDVVEQFARDKKELEEQKRPKVEDTRLPGWGHWSGPDYKDKPLVAKRRKKFAKPVKPTSSQNSMPNVWVNPNRNDAIRRLQPKKVPFPYTSADQYEASMRHPVSRGFVRESAYKALNKPKVVTKLGHIIKPLDKDDFFKKKDLDDDEEFGKSDDKDNKKHAGPIKFWNTRKAIK